MLHHDSGAIADAPGFRSGGHGVDNHRISARLQRSWPFHGDGAAGRHHPRPGFQSFLDQRRGERLDQSAGGGGCAGGRLVLPGATARRDHPCPLHHLLAGWFGGPAHGPFEPADAFQGDRTHSGWFGFGWSFGGRWHGLAEIWLLVIGGTEPDDKHGCAFDDLVGLPVASSILYPPQRDAVFAPFRREPDRRAFFYSLARGMDGLLIGRFYGAFSVGLYSRASALLARPLEQFMNPIEAVFVPAFSRLQIQPDALSQFFFLSFIEAIAVVGFLFTGMCFALAHPLTLVVLGPKWEKAAIIFAGLTFAALQYPLTYIRHLAFRQPGSRQRFISREFDYRSHCGRFFHCRPAVRAGRSGDFLFRLLFADPVAGSFTTWRDEVVR